MPAAANQAHGITFVYVPPSGSSAPFFQQEVSDITIRVQNKQDGGFVYSYGSKPIIEYLPGPGSGADSVQYCLEHCGLSFGATSRVPVPWSSKTKSPEGLLGVLPLPLHWYVRSFSSRCDFHLRLPDGYLTPPEDRHGACTVHEEKNWANSFPSAHHWVLGRNESNGNTISLAGGRTLGMDAYLIGYRNPKSGLEIDFRPPFALRFLGLAPFLSVRRDWEKRCFTIEASNLQWKLVVDVSAPKESFFSLSEPFPEGFRKNWLAQSLDAVAGVQLWRRRWRRMGFAGWEWVWVCGDVFERAGMEFGGEYYPDRGTDRM